ncbi:MAG: helix-turn-helix transcriptional regulator [Clostridiales bacterium]|nr:helix-turn-helix transcriptional regulator [Clostridiales bacterium]
MNDFAELQYRQRGRDPLYQRKHSHDDWYEFIQPLSDGGNVLIRDRVYPIKKGAIYVINAVNIHCTNPDDIDSYVRNKLIVNRNFADSLISMMGLGSFLNSVLKDSGGGCYELDAGTADMLDIEFKRAVSARSEGKLAKAVTVSSFTRILSTLAGLDINEAVHSTHISRILDYINLHICEQITIDEIADGVNLSKFYLCRLFRDKTGMTLMDYILERRLSIARGQLIESDKSILEIAEDCGFSSGSYFCRIFHENEGMTPRQYRKVHMCLDENAK